MNVIVRRIVRNNENTMKLFFVRHGQTNYNLKHFCNSDPSVDVHLTELGKQQAISVAIKLEKIAFDAVFISQLQRTRETASIITTVDPNQFRVDSRLNDRKTGTEGKLVVDFFNALEPDFFHAKLKNGESFQEEKRRVFSFLDELKKHNVNNILIVSHSETMKIVNGYYNGLSDKEMWHTRIDNCAVLQFDL